MARAALAVFLLVLAASTAVARADQPLDRADVLWLGRITYGVDGATVARYRELGRRRFLADQLRPGTPLPDDVRAALNDPPPRPIEEVLAEDEAETQRIKALPEAEQQEARMARNQAAKAAADEAVRRHLLRALWSPNQLKEQLVWFWLDHFSVFRDKGTVRLTVADYEDRAVRPHVLGKFKDLLLATVLHPAMLAYLDNTQSAAGKVNENYARELLELHTLGVDGGYSQKDVQELARVLTGLGVYAGEPPPKLKPALRPLWRAGHGVAFNPARHDLGDKVVLGTRIKGEGFPEIERVVALLAAHPATARHVCRKLATYWLGAEPPDALVKELAERFRKTDGDLTEVTRALLESDAFEQSLGRGVKDPMHFVLSALRAAYDGRHFPNLKPVQGWLSQLGEPPFGRVTPDGYPLTGAAFVSPGQLAKRYEIARAIGSGRAALFDTGEAAAENPRGGFPMLASRLYWDAMEPALSPPTRVALERATSQQEWNTFLLFSPDFMAR